jgi:hypothetical protein
MPLPPNCESIEITHDKKRLRIPRNNLHLVVDHSYGLVDLVAVQEEEKKIFAVSTAFYISSLTSGRAGADSKSYAGVIRFPCRKTLVEEDEGVLREILNVAKKHLGASELEEILYKGPFRFISSGSEPGP